MLRASALGLVLRRPACSPAAPCLLHRTPSLTPPLRSDLTATFSTFRPVGTARTARSYILREPPPHTTASKPDLGPEVRDPPPHITPPGIVLDPEWDLEVLLPNQGGYEQMGSPRVVVKHHSPRQLARQAIHPRSQHPFADDFEGHANGLPAHGTHSSMEMFNAYSPAPRAELLDVLGRSSSLEDAWAAYHALLSLPHDTTLPPNTPHILHAHLHRLAEMLASARPYTRTTFLRLLSVLSTIHLDGGHVHVKEWNALINFAGKGWRRLRPQDFQNAMSIYEDFVSGAPPGATLNGGQKDREIDLRDEWSRGTETGGGGFPEERVKPDIYTYTTLIDIACRTGHVPAVHHAMQLLKLSGLAPTRITHLILLRFFTRTQDLASVRDTLAKMRQHGHDIGVDGMNAVIWAFAQNGHLDVAGWIYRVMRNNLVPEDTVGEGSIGEVVAYLDGHEDIVVPNGLIPDATTYTTLVQGYAYEGELSLALQTFMDMLTSPDLSKSDSQHRPSSMDCDDESPTYGPTLPAFRALFLGFARHSSTTASKFQLSEQSSFSARMVHRRIAASGPSDWTEDQLFLLFKAFLALPPDARPSERVIYWVLIAFDKATDHDVPKLRRVYRALERRFGGGWGGRIQRFKASIFPGTKSVEESGRGGG